MADSTKGDRPSSDRTAEENDVLVASYFAMLAEEMAGRSYVKAQYRRAVTQGINRSDGVVERKYMNVSAVLMKIGLPRIRGYAPGWNAQFGGLSLAIESYLATDGSLLAPSVVSVEPPLSDDPFVLPPDLAAQDDRQHESIRRLVCKFDPVSRDAHNRALGRQGEAFAVELEVRRLHAAGRRDLMREVRWVADLDGDGAGYDVRSFDAATGALKMIEVKTTCGDEVTPFFLTRNEHSLALERPEAFSLYRVFDFSARPRLFELRPPLGKAVRLEAAVWMASFG